MSMIGRLCSRCGRLTSFRKGGERRNLHLCPKCFMGRRYGLDNPDLKAELTRKEGIERVHRDYYDGFED